MSTSSVRSTAIQKVREAVKIFFKEGFKAFVKKIYAFVVYRLRGQHHFVYFVFALDQSIPPFAFDEPLTVRIAVVADMERIQTELFPFLVGEFAYEKRYFTFLGRDDVCCFVAERAGKLVHYSWVFMDALRSPIMDTPFDRRKLQQGDVQVGPAFTVPIVRGTWIYPAVLMHILRFCKEQPYVNRVLLFVQGENPSAVNFFRRLGFKEMT